MFLADLELGKKHEQVIAEEFRYRNLPLIQTEGKHQFDAFLYNRSLEMKLDIKSLATQYAAIEEPTIRRQADFYIHTLCTTYVFPRDVYEAMYYRGKVVKMGDQQYDGRLIPKQVFRSNGIYLDQFLKQWNETPTS